MKAYLIDPLTQTVTLVERQQFDLKDIYALIDADCFDCARINRDGDAIYVDDEGLLRTPHPNGYFFCSLYPQPLAGKGLLLGSDGEGRSISPAISLQRFADTIAFLTFEQLQQLYRR